jgi:hypothetical protein
MLHARCVCRTGDETGYHAVVECPRAKALRQELRGSWNLPGEEQFRYNGPDWLILLLSSISREVGAYILLMFWRAWFLRNDVLHGKGTASIIASTKFLTRYAESLQVGRQETMKELDAKGKTKVHEEWPRSMVSKGRSTGSQNRKLRHHHRTGGLK